MQCDLFRSQAVYKWPCTAAGDRTHEDDRLAYKYWRARPAPQLSASWETVMIDHSQSGVVEDERIRLHWRHPRPITRAENEMDSWIAVSINPECFAWTVHYIPLVGVTGWPWSRGRSDSLEAAKRDALARLMRLSGYHLHPESLEITDAV